MKIRYYIFRHKLSAILHGHGSAKTQRWLGAIMGEGFIRAIKKK